jgi:hypothetical protein
MATTEMLQWTAAGTGPRFMAILHHTDAIGSTRMTARRTSGKLDKALDEANARGWTVVDMKRDWIRVFPRE